MSKVLAKMPAVRSIMLKAPPMIISSTRMLMASAATAAQRWALAGSRSVTTVMRMCSW